MREVKFRSWLKESEEMIYEFVMDSPIVTETDKNILMQYTGLNDTNGREIYEGDLYSYELSVETNASGTHQKYTEKVIEVIEFKDGAFYHGDELLADVIEHDDTFTYLGNIYENPELVN